MNKLEEIIETTELNSLDVALNFEPVLHADFEIYTGLCQALWT